MQCSGCGSSAGLLGSRPAGDALVPFPPIVAVRIVLL
jgi:hypothetical protein